MRYLIFAWLKWLMGCGTKVLDTRIMLNESPIPSAITKVINICVSIASEGWKMFAKQLSTLNDISVLNKGMSEQHNLP